MSGMLIVELYAAGDFPMQHFYDHTTNEAVSDTRDKIYVLRGILHTRIKRRCRCRDSIHNVYCPGRM